MNVSISVSLPVKMLTDIQRNVKGANRAEKIRLCIQLGYPLAIQPNLKVKGET